jgi:alpha-amylase
LSLVEGAHASFSVQGYGPEFAGEYVLDTVGADALNVGEFWIDLSYSNGKLDYNQNGARQVRSMIVT